MLTHISVRGAREHNLKGVNVEIPRDALTVITGLSGSGKSSLAFDTIYAEGQRRYVESLVVDLARYAAAARGRNTLTAPHNLATAPTKETDHQ